MNGIYLKDLFALPKHLKIKRAKISLPLKPAFFNMRANDWEANNMDATPQSLTSADNPGGYDAVNRYGDEADRGNVAKTFTSPGLNRYNRTGYLEKDIVDYNTKNLKASLALHYKVKPEVEVIYASSFGNGTHGVSRR